MCKLGAKVTGIDASEKNIKVAKLHSKKNNLKIRYLCSSPEKLETNEKFDVILNMEIVEHVNDVDFFLGSCGKLLKKNLHLVHVQQSPYLELHQICNYLLIFQVRYRYNLF